MLRISFLIIICCLLATTSCNNSAMEKDSERIAEEKTENNLKDENFEKDWEFLIKAQSDVLMELELSKLAQKNANSLQLKELARTIMQDQLQVKEDLELLASKKMLQYLRRPVPNTRSLLKRFRV